MRTDRFLYLILTVVFIVLLYNLNSWDIGEGIEAQFAEISREMLKSGDYLHPRLLAIGTYQMPPLPYWLMSLGMRLWGVNPFGVRFFAQVALVMQAGLIYHIALRLLGSPRIALFAGLIYLSFPLVLWGSRCLSADVFLVLFELGAVYSLLLYYLERLPLALYGLSICLGLGLLTAGFRIFALPFLLLLYVLIFGQGHRQGRFHWRHGLFSLLLLLLLGGGWYVYVAWGQTGFGSYFWQTYGWESFFDQVVFAQRWWQYPLVLVAGSLPWFMVFVVSVLGALWRNKIAAQLCLFWLLLLFAFLILASDTTFLSLLSVLSGLSIILSYGAHLLTKEDIQRYSFWFLQVYLVVGGLALGVPLCSQLLGERMVLTWPMAITALGTLVVVAVLFRLIKAGVRFRVVAISLVAALCLLLYSGYFWAANPFGIESTQALAKRIQDRQLQDLPILVFDQALPSLAFNLDRDIITIDDGHVTPDVRFQTRSNWRSRWVLADVPNSVRYLRRLITAPSVLVVSGELPDNWTWLKPNYTKSERVGHWQIFYRPQ